MSETEVNGKYISPFIGDGYDLERTIPAQPGRWSAVKLRYRPMSADEQSLIWARNRQAPHLSMVSFEAETLATKILGWDLRDRDGKPLEISADTLRGLSPQFFDVLKCVVDGAAIEDDTKNS